MIIKTAKEGCLQYQTLVEADRLAWSLQQVPGVQTTAALTNAVRNITAGSNEGAPKWLTIARNQDVLNYGAQQASVNNPDLFNTDCSVMPVIAYLADHRAETLDRVVQVSGEFAEAHSTPDRKFLLAAGSAGIEAATNIVVRKAWVQMLLLVYGAVIVLCFITFRSWRAVVVAVVPLVITSVLCEALMVALGIGVKVATLPVVALGVGIGIDYALYLLSVQLAAQRAGASLAEAYRSALQLHRQGGGAGRRDAGRGRRHLDALADQVPGRHGPAAGLHVRLEHGRRRGADPGDVALPAARRARPARSGSRRCRPEAGSRDHACDIGAVPKRGGRSSRRCRPEDVNARRFGAAPASAGNRAHRAWRHDGAQGIDRAVDLVDRVVEIEAQAAARLDAERLVRESRAVAAGTGFDAWVVQCTR